jgi:hypothetical protein
MEVATCPVGETHQRVRIVRLKRLQLRNRGPVSLEVADQQRQGLGRDCAQVAVAAGAGDQFKLVGRPIARVEAPRFLVRVRRAPAMGKKSSSNAITA